MEQAKISSLLMGSKDPKPDIGFLWTAADDSQYNRYECEMQQIAGALERLGYEPNFINLNDLGAGAYTNYKVLVLPRNMRVDTVVPNSTNKPVLRVPARERADEGHAHPGQRGPARHAGRERPRRCRTSRTRWRSCSASTPRDVGGYEVPPRARRPSSART